MVQETHITSIEEGDDLEREWRRLWGVQNSGSRCTYWSVGNRPQGGVGILIVPGEEDKINAWNRESWTNRIIAVKHRNLGLIVNLYAPNKARDRETFFEGIRRWNWDTETDVIIGGDFNCVLTPVLDRRGDRPARARESVVLEEWINERSWMDARELMLHAEDDSQPQATDHFTYWESNRASRIDRFYVSIRWRWQVQWVDVNLPPVHSDHQAVTLHLSDPKSKTKTTNTPLNHLTYPIRSSNEDQVHMNLMAELVKEGIGTDNNTFDWDSTVTSCKRAIAAVTKRNKANRRKISARLHAQTRARLITRRQLIQAQKDDITAIGLQRLGKRLELTPDNIRSKFRSWSNWERDQNVTHIRVTNAREYDASVGIADRFAIEWGSIQGRQHSAVSNIENMREAVRNFATVPENRTVSPEDSTALMAEITISEVARAIDDLNRHKAAGPDGLNNDFYKDTTGILAPILTKLSNELLAGKEPPKSFLAATIIPLRKKGDSDNAMDYRPIALLQTSYKIFTKILATRLQQFLGKLIGATQQGFVHGRQIQKSVVMMLAHLERASSGKYKDSNACPGILLLDFKKAYDTLSRTFMMVALEQFGFDPKFVALMQKLHSNTTAQFLVNGELSQPAEVVTGIRQGCPLAPLLFIIAAEFLALALTQASDIKGILVPGGKPNERHIFSGFVDDSTIFLERTDQLSAALRIIHRFGEISGLHVQPNKSWYIFLDKAIQISTVEGIPVLQSGTTTRYLGYQVGCTNLREVNWADRLQRIRRRLITAAAKSTSIADRVLILNVIVLPSLLYTAIMFQPTDEIITELVRLQKQFLWKGNIDIGKVKHKLSPGLIFTPKKAGGLGLIAIAVALKTQRVKHAMLWLIQPGDVYRRAWHSWQHFNDTVVYPQYQWMPSPRAACRQTPAKRTRTPHWRLRQELGEWLAPDSETRLNRQQQSGNEIQFIDTRTHCWMDEEDTLFLIVPQDQFPTMDTVPDSIEKFWNTFSWADNPWICDCYGGTLKPRDYPRIRPCRLDQLRIRQIDEQLYTVRVSRPEGVDAHHKTAKLRRWLISILVATPANVRNQFGRSTAEVTLRQAPGLSTRYTWTVMSDGQVKGQPTQGTKTVGSIQLCQEPNGIDWKLTTWEGNSNVLNDWKVLERYSQTTGIVINASPHVHGFPWEVGENVKNNRVLQALKKQPFTRYRHTIQKELRKTILKLENHREASEWALAIQGQTPAELWQHQSILTDFQVWTAYRAAVGQLNLYYEGYAQDPSCKMTTTCSHTKETLEHLLWECPRAQQVWKELVEHWIGATTSSKQLQAYKVFIVSRRAPQVGKKFEHRSVEWYGEFSKHHATAASTIWWAYCSIATAAMWMQRNNAIFRNERVSTQEGVSRIWRTAIRQLRAVAQRDSNRIETKMIGIRLRQMLDCFEYINIQASDNLEPPPTPRPRKQFPIVKWLKLFQGSVN